MRDTTNLKSRIKGLLGIILSVCTLVSMSGMSVYADGYGVLASDETIETTVIRSGESISGASGGAVSVTIDGEKQKGDQDAGTTYETTYYFYNYTIPGDETATKYYLGKVESRIENVDLSSKKGSDWSSSLLRKISYTQVYPYDIKFDMNGGVGDPQYQRNLMGGLNVSLENVNTIRDGYTFLGWATTASATTAQYTAGGTFKYSPSQNGETVTLYAVWDQDPLNGGSIGGAGTYKLNSGDYSYDGSFSIGDGFTYTGGRFYVPTAGTYTFR